jgi:cell division septum initiation protein DivIVA
MDKLLEACKYEQEVLKHNFKVERMKLETCLADNEDLKKEINELEGKISMIKFIAKLS